MLEVRHESQAEEMPLVRAGEGEEVRKLYADNDDCQVMAAVILGESDRSLRCRFGDTDASLPISKIDYSGDVGSRDVVIVMPFWLAEQRELENFIQS